MPLPSSIAWRVVQLVSVFWCVLLSVSVCLCSHWTVYDKKSFLRVLLKVIEKDKNFEAQNKSDIDSIWTVLHGSLGVTVAAIIAGVLTSYAIVVEKRWVAIVFAVFNGVLFIATVSFFVMAFVARNNAVTLTRKMLEHGIERYTVLDGQSDQEDLSREARWRFVVDQIQIQGHCCGSSGHTDYKGMFLSISGDKKNLTACVCRDDARSDCWLQHLPLSCCKRQALKSANPLCAANVFRDLPSMSATCNSTKNGTASSTNTKRCSELIHSMQHILYLLYHGILNAVIAFMTCVLTVMLSLLAWKTATRKEFVEEEIQMAFKVSSRKAAKMLDEAKGSSRSIVSVGESRTRSFSQMDEPFGPQRVSSDRLAPRRDSIRYGSSDRRGQSSRRRPVPDLSGHSTSRRPRPPSRRRPSSDRLPPSADRRMPPRRK